MSRFIEDQRTEYKRELCDSLEITSTGILPVGFSQEEFFSGISVPRNKELMRVFKDMELVEYMGSGVPRILQAYDRSCFIFTEHFIRIVFHYEEGYNVAAPADGASREPESQSGTGVQSGVQSNMREQVLQLLAVQVLGKREIAERLGKSGRTRYLNDLMKKLLEEGSVEYTIPQKPHSRLQKYRLVERK